MHAVLTDESKDHLTLLRFHLFHGAGIIQILLSPSHSNLRFIEERGSLINALIMSEHFRLDTPTWFHPLIKQLNWITIDVRNYFTVVKQKRKITVWKLRGHSWSSNNFHTTWMKCRTHHDNSSLPSSKFSFQLSGPPIMTFVESREKGVNKRIAWKWG